MPYPVGLEGIGKRYRSLCIFPFPFGGKPRHVTHLYYTTRGFSYLPQVQLNLTKTPEHLTNSEARADKRKFFDERELLMHLCRLLEWWALFIAPHLLFVPSPKEANLCSFWDKH